MKEKTMQKSAILVCAVLLFVGIVNVTRAQDDETRKHVLHELGGPFIVYRSSVQGELKLSEDQKHQLIEKESGYVQETIKAFEKLKNLSAEEHERQIQSHRQIFGEKLWAFLKVTLKAEQLKRFQQLELQHEGPAGLGRPEIVKELKISQEQLQQFMGVIQDLQKKVEPLMKEAQSGGNPQEIRSKVIKIREGHEGKIEDLLNDTQKKQWKEMLGKPFDTLND